MTRLLRCLGCGKHTRDFLTSFTADRRQLVFCRERGCADRWRAAL